MLKGDTLSLTLFNLHVDDLKIEPNKLHMSITFGDSHLCILLYAVDMVLLSHSVGKLQKC